MGKQINAIVSFVLGMVCLCNLVRAEGSALKYQFKDQPEAVYQFNIRADYPQYIETNTGMLAYHINSVDPANGQIQLSYNTEMHENKQQKHPEDNPPGPGGFPMPPPFPFAFAPAKATPDIMIASDGTVLRTNRNDDESQLPHMLGLAWQLMLQPLPADGAATWKTDRATSVYTKTGSRQQWPPPPPWQRQAENRVDHAARENVTYTAGPADGSIVTVQKKYELVTDEKVGTNPYMQQTGEGQFKFDTAAGLIQSMEMSYTIEVNQENVSVKIPVTVNVRRLTAEEMADLKAKRQAAVAEARVQAEKRRVWADGQKKAEENTIRTAQVGGPGGMPFVNIEAQERPLMGVRFTLGSWGGRQCVRNLEPLYEKPADDSNEKTVDILAKPGYAVGGLVVNMDKTSKEIYAMQVIFARLEKDTFSKTDQYRGPMVGEENKSLAHIALAGKGESVVGIFGRHGLNIDAVGLVLKDPDYKPDTASTQATATETPTDAQPLDADAKLKLIEAGWQKTTGKPIDVLSHMSQSGGMRFRGVGAEGEKPTKDEDGNVILAARQRLGSSGNYPVPSTFRIVCMSEKKDFRIGYAADQIIFNWEMNADELRVDGGPASGEHKPGFGALPTGEWVGIELAVTPSTVTIYIDGKRRYRASGDFSDLNKPFTIEAHNGDLKIKSITVVH